MQSILDIDVRYSSDIFFIKHSFLQQLIPENKIYVQCTCIIYNQMIKLNLNKVPEKSSNKTVLLKKTYHSV